MTTEVNALFYQTYAPGIRMLAQQMRCKLAGAVDASSEKGKRVNYDQIGLVHGRTGTTRAEDTPISNVQARTRWLSNLTIDVGDLLDLEDLVRILHEPGGRFTKAMIASLNRMKDQQIVAAMLGTAFTGEDGTVSTVLPAAQQIAAGGTGFTYGKLESAADLLRGKVMFDDDDSEELFVAWTRAQEKTFLQNPEVKSVDYNTNKVLMKGSLRDFYGFTFIRLEDFTDQYAGTQRLLPKVSTTRTCVAWVKSKVIHNVAAPIDVMVAQDPSKRFGWRWYGWSVCGSTRLQEEGVVQIDVVEP